MRVSASFILSALLVQEGAARPSRYEPPSQPKKSIYILSNEPANSVIAVPIGMDGKLYGGTCTATGGMGATTIDGATQMPPLSDGLVSQSCLTVAGHVSNFPFGKLRIQHMERFTNSFLETVCSQCRLQYCFHAVD